MAEFGNILVQGKGERGAYYYFKINVLPLLNYLLHNLLIAILFC